MYTYSISRLLFRLDRSVNRITVEVRCIYHLILTAGFGYFISSFDKLYGAMIAIVSVIGVDGRSCQDIIRLKYISWADSGPHWLKELKLGFKPISSHDCLLSEVFEQEIHFIR